MALAIVTVMLLAFLSGCSSQDGASYSANPTVCIGTMPTEDILPMWVAEDKGYFDEFGVSGEVVVFDSAQSLSAALAAGQIDMAMTDVMRAAKLCESGTPVVAEWTTLGETPSEGRFGILVPESSDITDISDLASQFGSGRLSQGVGVAANTVPEYVLDMICEQAGIDQESIQRTEIASLPDRFSLLAAGSIDAAALPNSLLVLGQANGMRVISDDTDLDSASISIMVATQSFDQSEMDAIVAVGRAWDKAAREMNQNSDEYVGLLVEKAGLNAQIQETYELSRYPMALDAQNSGLAHPSAAQVDSVLRWMERKSYSTYPLAYDQSTGQFLIEG